MADKTDVLLKFCEQQWVEAKQSEDQRAAFTNIVVLVAGASFAFIAQKGFTAESIPLSLLVLVLGCLGAVASVKLYERHQFHIARLRNWRAVLDQLHPDARLEASKSEAVAKHEGKHPWFSKLRLHRLWVALHILIAVSGLVTAVVAVIQSLR